MKKTTEYKNVVHLINCVRTYAFDNLSKYNAQDLMEHLEFFGSEPKPIDTEEAVDILLDWGLEPEVIRLIVSDSDVKLAKEVE